MGRQRVVYGGYIYTDLDGWTKGSLQLGVLILWQLTNINVINNLWVASYSSTKMVMETTWCIIFMYVCMYVCMYVRMYVCMYVYVCMCMYVCTYVRTYVCIYIYIYIYMYIQNYPYRIAPGNLSKSDSGTVSWWSWSCCPSLCQRWKSWNFPMGFDISHRIHGAGIYANMTRVYWW